MSTQIPELIKALIKIYEDYGADFVTLFNSVSDLFTITGTSHITTCSKCGEEYERDKAVVCGETVFVGKCECQGG